MREPIDWPTRDLVTHRINSTPDRPAVIGANDGEQTTYRELDAAVDETAAVIDQYLATPGGRVATLVDTRDEVSHLLFGAMRRGVTLAPLNVELEPATLDAQLAALDPDLLVCEQETEELATEIAACPIVSLDTPADAAVEPVESAETAVEPVPLSRDDTQLILFTSGTTSEPKGVKLTVGNLVASATASAFRLGVLPTDRWLVCLPTYHMGGLAPLTRSVLYGTSVVIQRAFDTERTQRVIEARDVTGISLVPTMLTRLLDAGWEPPSELRFVLLGGGPASETLIERCEQRDVPVCPTYGMTETASQIATALPETAVSYPGTVGQPLAFTDVTVVSDGEPCQPGEQGKLVVDGPTVTPGYIGDDQTTSAFGPNGFRTGDLGYRDEDGRLWVVGRADDRLVTGGETVVASEIAAAIRDHPAVDDVAVVGLPDEEWGERVAALVVGEVTVEDIRTFCSRRLAPYEVPKTIQLRDALPRTASGTVDRATVRTLLQE